MAPDMITRDEVAGILYSHRFHPTDTVGPLIESLIKHLAATDPTFNDARFRQLSDYPYNSNGEHVGS